MGAENFGDKLVLGSLDENRELTEEKLSLQGSASLKSCDKEEIVEELKTCLPKWVTQKQVRDMIRGISGNVIEIVDHFYEHETKFYEQVSAFISLSSREEVSLGNDEVFVSKLEFIDCKSEGNQSSCSSQFHKLRSMSNSKKSRISPVKRNKKLKGKQKKKVKACSKVDPGGPKQATITKFFSKASSHET